MISSTDSAISYSGNESTSTGYPFDFPLIEASHLKATVTDSGGTVTAYDGILSVAPERDSYNRITSGSVTTSTAIPASSTIRFYRETPATQTLDLAAGGTLPPEATETALDRVVMIAQEARRDAAYSGTPEISLAGLGLVAQVAADSFVARTISPASGSPLTVTNGDGVDGNPTVAFDLSGLTALGAFDANAIFTVQTGAGFVTLTGAQIKAGMRETTYRTFEIPASAMIPATSGGCTVSADTGLDAQEITARFGGVTATKGYVRFFVPNDYAGGTIQIRPRFIGHGGDVAFLTSRAVFNVRSTRQRSGLPGPPMVWDPDPSATPAKYRETFNGGQYGDAYGTMGSAMPLGTDYTFGDGVIVEFERDPTDILDDSNGGIVDYTATILGFTVQYAAASVVSPWS